MIGYYPDEMDTPERVRYSLYLMYFRNAKRFEIAGTPILCCKCSTVVPKSDYIQNHGYCSVCRKLLDDTATTWHFGDHTD